MSQMYYLTDSSVRWCLAVRLACGDQRRLTGNGSALEVVLHDYALYKSTFTLLYLLCCVALILFPIPNSQPTATELFQSPLYGSGTVFRSISHLLRHFPSSAFAWRHTSSNAVTRNYCCRARKVTLSCMDVLITLTYLLNWFISVLLLLMFSWKTRMRN